MIAFKQDATTLFGEAAGRECATVCNDTTLQAIDGHGGEDDQAAGGEHGVLVLDQCGDLALGGGDAGQRAVVGKVERNGFARSQRHGTGLGNDDAFVAHFGCQ